MTTNYSKRHPMRSPQRQSASVLVQWLCLVVTMVGISDSVHGQREQSGAASWDQPTVLTPECVANAASACELIIGLDAESERRDLERSLASHGMVIVGEIPRLRAVKVWASGSLSLDGACEVASALPGIRYAEPNGLGSCDGVALSLPAADQPNDSYFDLQWHLRNTGQFGGVPGADIQALPAWGLADGGSALVAVLDSGIDYSHPELAGRVLQGFDFVAEDADATGANPHGLYVAGIIAASTDNAFGVAGVCPQCRILPIKVIADGVGSLGTVFDLAQGIDYATVSSAAVINMSLGNYPSSRLLEAALEAAVAAGVVVVSAAGNGGSADVQWPAASVHAMSIGATDDSDVKTASSSTGVVLDFVAPGHGIFTVANQHEDGFKAMSGTSASAAIASGIAGLLKSHTAQLSHDQVYSLLQAGAEDQVGAASYDSSGWDPFYGHGRLNALLSLKALCSCEADSMLVVSPPQLDFGIEGTWQLRLAAGENYAANPYLILGTLSGIQAPFVLGRTAWPIVADSYTRLCLIGPSPVTGGVGVLDGHGQAIATITLPASARDSLAGSVFHHVAAVYDGEIAGSHDRVPLLLSEPVASAVAGLPSTVFASDFEDGGAGWQLQNGANGQWHIAIPGECGASSIRAAYNSGAPACSVGNATSGRLVSPTFVMSGLPPYRITLATVVDMGSSQVALRLVDETKVATLKPQQWTPEQFGEVVDGKSSTYSIVVAESTKYEGRAVHLEADVVYVDAGSGNGWWIDDVAVWNAGIGGSVQKVVPSHTIIHRRP